MIAPICRKAVTPARLAAALPLHRLINPILHRFFRTAGISQPQLDPDYDAYNVVDDNSNFYNPLFTAPVPDNEGSVPARGVQWAFIGCRKRVFAETLSKVLEVPYISMVTLVRQDLNPRSSIYKQIANAVNKGELVPEHVFFGLLSRRLDDRYEKGETGFILDGIPRSLFQAVIIDQLTDIDLVVNFKCTEDYLAKLREEGAWNDKLRAYIEQSKLLEDYYGKQKNLLNFPVSSAPMNTWQGLMAALHIQHSIL